MSNYTDITDGVQDGFNFEVRGKKFYMRYPITSEVDSMQQLSNKLEAAQEAGDDDGVKNYSAELEDFMYGFIEPVEHETSIRDALKAENIRVMRNFNTMIKTELSIS